MKKRAGSGGWVGLHDETRKAVSRLDIRFTHLAARFARGLLWQMVRLTLEIRGRRESRVSRYTRGLVCQNAQRKTHTSIQVQRRHPTFPAQWFTAYSALSPVTGLCLPPSSAEIQLPPNLTPASRRQDHTTSPSAAGSTPVSRASYVHRIPCRYVRDVRETPLLIGTGCDGDMPVIWIGREAGNLFASEDWTAQIHVDLRSEHLVFSRRV